MWDRAVERASRENLKDTKKPKAQKAADRCVLEDSVCSLSAGCSLDMGVGLWYALITMYFSFACYGCAVGMLDKVWSKAIFTHGSF